MKNEFEDGVKFRHIRNYTLDADLSESISNMGGATICYKEVEPNKIRFAVALCSDKDNFEKKKGRIISAGRLKSDTQSQTVEMSYQEFKRNYFFPLD